MPCTSGTPETKTPTGISKIHEELPEGVTIEEVVWDFEETDIAKIALFVGWCKITDGRIFDCNIPSPIVANFLRLQAPGDKGSLLAASPSGWSAPIYINVAVAADAAGTGENRLTIEGAGDPSPEEEIVRVPFNGTPAPFGVATFEADVFRNAVPEEQIERQAGAHPFEQRVDFELNKRTGIDPSDGKRYIVANGAIKSVEVTLPRGMVGNPEAVPKCSPSDFGRFGAVKNATGCPSNTQVGYLNLHATSGTKNYGRSQFILNPAPEASFQRVAIYNMVPPRGVPADFAFTAGAVVQGHIYPELDPAQNYAIRTLTPEISSLIQPAGSEVVFWGVPGDPAHDKFRFVDEFESASGSTVSARTSKAARSGPCSPTRWTAASTTAARASGWTPTAPEQLLAGARSMAILSTSAAARPADAFQAADRDAAGQPRRGRAYRASTSTLNCRSETTKRKTRRISTRRTTNRSASPRRR